MKRYKLLKDLPTHKAGSKFLLIDIGLVSESDSDKGCLLYDDATLQAHPNILKDWFEEIPEQPKTVWDLRMGDAYYIPDWDDQVGFDTWLDRPKDLVRRTLGNCSLTKEEAEKELARRKAKVVLERDTKGFKPDWTSSDEDRYYVCLNLFCGFRTKNHLGHLSVANARWAVLDAIFFATRADAEASIKAHEKEWKTYLGVED